MNYIYEWNFKSTISVRETPDYLRMLIYGTDMI